MPLSWKKELRMFGWKGIQQKFKKSKSEVSKSILFDFRLFDFSSSLSTLNGLSFVLLAAHVQRKRSKKEQKGCRHLLFLRLGRAYARFWWRNFRWWNFRWRGVRWSVRKTCWVSVGPIRLLFFFEECCWCQTDLRDHFPYKHLHRFRLASELWVCLLILHFQF